jgi:hypothetical protein
MIYSEDGALADEMYFEFDFEQIGERLSGYSYVFLHENYAKFEIEGWIHDSLFEFSEIDMLESKIMSGFEWCYAKGKLNYACKNGYATLKGNYTSQIHLSRQCPGGTIYVRHEKPCGAIPALEDTELFSLDSNGVLQKVMGRDAKKGHKISIQRPFIIVQLKDNHEADNDSVSLYYNDEPLVEDQRLKKFPKTIELRFDLQAPFHYLTFHAVNLGDKPPNTAAIIIHDGEKKQKAQIESDLERSDIIYLKYKPQRSD